MIDQAIMAKAARIKLLVFDVDGVLTNGQITFSEQHEIKSFHVQDGTGIRLVQETGVQIAVITGRYSRIVAKRMDELGVLHVLQAQTDKLKAMQTLQKNKLDAEEIAYVGDDLLDLSLIQYVGLGIAVANASELIKPYADWITTKHGGEGAAREVCELIMRAQDTLTPLCQRYLV